MKAAVTRNLTRWYQDYYPLVKDGPEDRPLGEWAAITVVPGSWVDIEISRLACTVGPSKAIIKGAIGQLVLNRRTVHSLQSTVKKSIALEVVPYLDASEVELAGISMVRT
jgi:hypothetical protein